MNERSLKIKVALVVVVAVVLFIGFMSVLGRFSMGDKIAYFVEFQDSGSLLQGAPVKVAGVRAGRIEAVQFLAGRTEKKSPHRGIYEAPVNVRIHVILEASFAPAIRENSEFYVTSQGVLGEKYLEVVPGSAESPVLTDGAYVRGTDPARLDQLMSRGDAILRHIDAALVGTEDVNIADLVFHFTNLTQHLDAYLVSHQPQIESMTANLNQILGDLQSIIAEIKAHFDARTVMLDVKEIKESLTSVLHQFDRTLHLADGAFTDIHTVVNELVKAENREQIQRVINHLMEALSEAKALLSHSDQLVLQVSEGHGLVGQMLQDRTMYDALKEIVRLIKRHPWKLFWED